jgi:hypothetical protein
VLVNTSLLSAVLTRVTKGFLGAVSVVHAYLARENTARKSALRRPCINPEVGKYTYGKNRLITENHPTINC